MEEGLCIKGQTSQGENECCYYTHTIYYPTQKQTGIYFILFLLFFFETNDVAPLWLSPVDSLFSLTRVLYISIRWKKGTIEITHPKGESQINIHTRRTGPKKERKKVCVIIIFSLLFFFGLSGQMIDKCKFFFLVDILPTLFCPAYTRIQPFIRFLPPVIRCLCKRETGAVCASYSLFFFPLQNLVYRGGNGTLLGSTAQHWPSPENLPIARQTPISFVSFFKHTS